MQTETRYFGEINDGIKTSSYYRAQSRRSFSKPAGRLISKEGKKDLIKKQEML